MSKTGGFHLWPRSLYGQILLVVAAALLVAQGINAAMLLAGARNRAVAEAAAQLVGRVTNFAERQRERAEAGLPDSQQSQPVLRPRIEGLHRRPTNIIVRTDSERLTVARYEDHPELAARASEFLAQTDFGLSDIHISTVSLAVLPQPIQKQLHWRANLAGIRGGPGPKPHHAVLFTAKLPDGRFINAAGLIRPDEAASIIALLLQTLTLYIAVMIPLALVARRISRPLRQLTGRVQRVGLTEGTPLASEGPEDIQQLIDAFNAMQSRVSSLLGEKDVMLGAIGHDLKTPLAALRVRIESVEDDAEREKMATTIDEMVTILDDILMLARLGRSGEAPQRTDLDALVESVVEEFEDGGKAASFSASSQRHVATCRPVLLRRALRNLISNAVLYGKQAKVSVEQSGNRLNICIDDDGPGIPEATIESMFEPFARAEKARNRATGGTGLGLTIARAIARSHGGDVRLVNRAEGGLRAILELPLSE